MNHEHHAERAREIVRDGRYSAAEALMDNEIREEMHLLLCPCSEVDFLTAYMDKHLDEFGEEFEI